MLVTDVVKILENIISNGVYIVELGSYKLEFIVVGPHLMLTVYREKSWNSDHPPCVNIKVQGALPLFYFVYGKEFLLPLNRKGDHWERTIAIGPLSLLYGAMLIIDSNEYQGA